MNCRLKKNLFKKFGRVFNFLSFPDWGVSCTVHQQQNKKIIWKKFFLLKKFQAFLVAANFFSIHMFFENSMIIMWSDNVTKLFFVSYEEGK
jgi:hypothetical protein